MTGHSVASDYPSGSSYDDWSGIPLPDPEPGPSNRTRYAIAFVVVLSVAVLCVAVFLAVQLLRPRPEKPTAVAAATTVRPTSDASPVPPTAEPTSTRAAGTAAIRIDPEQGTVGTLVSVTGEGWWPGEPVFLFLDTPGMASGSGYSYAAAIAGEDGSLRTAFTFPNEARWLGQSQAQVVARGSRSRIEASVSFALDFPTATPTPEIPTARPTTLPTYTPTASATATPTASPTPTLFISDWRGEYYANATLSGQPVLIRNDTAIDFAWGLAAPAADLPVDYFSVRWSRVVYFQKGLYRISAGADDGVRLWLDGKLIVDEWHGAPFTVYPIEVSLAEGNHSLLMEYYEELGEAQALLTWTEVKETPTPTATPTETPTVTPTVTPMPTTPPFQTEPWRASYYSNPALQGEPVLFRTDSAIDFHWGGGSPGPGVPSDYFSARWTQEIWLPAGTYRASADVDDGVRVWIDNVLIIDEWHTATGTVYTADVYIAEGVHSQRVEFLEESADAHVRFRFESVTP